jgi:Tfp pilus assembly protein PilN
MSILPARTTGEQPFVPGPASVNLLPPEIREIAAVQVLKRRLVIIGIAVLAAGAGVFATQQGAIMAADSDRDAVVAQHEHLQAQKEDLAPVAQYYAQVTKHQNSIQDAMAHEVLFSSIVDTLQSLAPDGVAVETVSLSADTDSDNQTTAASSATACPGPDPFNSGGIVGCVTITGSALSRDDVGALVTALNGNADFSGAFVSRTTADQETGEVSFTATVGLTDATYSNRYQDAEFIKGANQ